MLGIPLLDKVYGFLGFLVFELWFLVVWFLGFLVSKFLGFISAKRLEFLVVPNVKRFKFRFTFSGRY